MRLRDAVQKTFQIAAKGSVARYRKATKDRWMFSEDEIEISRRLGEGNFAMTHLARIKDDGRRVALKIPNTRMSDSEALEEMKALLEIGRHKNIVTFIGSVTINGNPCCGVIKKCR